MDPRRTLPPVDRVLAALEGLPHELLADAARGAVDAARTAIAQGGQPSEADVVADARARVNEQRGRLLQPVINATGVLLHTNLGRAPIGDEAIAAAFAIARGASNLELRMATGERGSRHEHAGALLARAVGAEAGMVVNNNAAAVLLALGALARGREVVVSRGELVEIGGGFRVPEIMAESGCTLVEVGTTNRTRRSDYEHAITPNTALLLKVHASNYRMIGFTEATPVADLARLGPPVMVDAGSGLLDDTTPWLPERPTWLRDEPGVRQAVDAGAGIVTFSGDKLLGGPQAGVIVGRADLVATIARHPLAHAMRADKLTLAALQQVALVYLSGDATSIPLWRMATASRERLRARAVVIAATVSAAEVIDTEAVAGGGSLPGLTIPSVGVAVAVRGADAALARLRSQGVIARTESDRVVCDLRSVNPSDDDIVAAALAARLMRVVATAGHVDHGKSTLVLALTGTDPDRFPEEKARGLTIDLGFAFTTLPSGTEVGFVDVPGHTRFIKNMLAGVGAVEVAMLVVAANEGWKPQSEEHLRILDGLGIRHGLVVVTKSELVDSETLEIAQLEVQDHVAGTSFEELEIVTCDARAGIGLDTLRGALDRALAAAPSARDDGRPRLWIDRVFVAKGAGTVVTGTLTGGSIAVDDELRAGEHRVRVRGIESHGTAGDIAEVGARVALNLVGVDHQDLHRGDAVVRPDQWRYVTTVDVAVAALPGVEVKRRGRLHAAVGSGEHPVWIRRLDDEYARVRFDRPLPLAPEDRMVLRDRGSNRTIAAATVLDTDPTRKAADAPARLRLPLGARILATGWVPADDVGSRTGLPDAAAQGLLIEDGGEAVGAWFVDAETAATLRRRAGTAVAEGHTAHPAAPGTPVADLARRLQLSVGQLEALVASALDLVLDRGHVRHRGHAGDPTESEPARALLATLDASPLAPPPAADRALASALVRAGALVEIDGIHFTPAAVAHARQLVVAALAERGSLTIADARDVLGSTRKYVVPLMSYLDREGVTRRRGDNRIPGPTSGLTDR